MQYIPPLTPQIIERRDALASLSESDPNLLLPVIRQMGKIAVRQTAISKLLENAQSQIQCAAASLHEAVRQKGSGRIDFVHTAEIPGVGLFSKRRITTTFTVIVT